MGGGWEAGAGTLSFEEQGSEKCFFGPSQQGSENRARLGGDRLAGVVLTLCSVLFWPPGALCRCVPEKFVNPDSEQRPSPSWEGRNQGNQIPAALLVCHARTGS